MGDTWAKDVMIKRKDMYIINPKKRIALARLRIDLKKHGVKTSLYGLYARALWAGIATLC